VKSDGVSMNFQLNRLIRLAGKFESNAMYALHAEAKRKKSNQNIDVDVGDGLSDLAKAFKKEFPNSKQDIVMLAPKKIGKFINRLKATAKKTDKSSSHEAEEAKRKLNLLIYRHIIS